jgi:hypothetical protein
MQGNKIYVQRRGNVFRIPMDTNGRPIPVASVDDDPPGFPFTCTSEAELKSLFPGAEFVYLTPKSNNTTLSYDANVEREALAMMGKPSNPPTQPTKAIAVSSMTAEPLKTSGVSHQQKAEEFLKRLQTALQYASKKHEKKLKDQVEIIEELIREVF